jgi:hypothetical protein
MHLDGLSYRKIENHTGISKSKVQCICSEKLEKLPDKNKFTYKYCNKFSQIFEFDAKYVNVKGYERKIAFQGISGAPTTTNMIESFNSHLEARLKPLHRFRSFNHAKLWLNGYVLK